MAYMRMTQQSLIYHQRIYSTLIELLEIKYSGLSGNLRIEIDLKHIHENSFSIQ